VQTASAYAARNAGLALARGDVIAFTEGGANVRVARNQRRHRDIGRVVDDDHLVALGRVGLRLEGLEALRKARRIVVHGHDHGESVISSRSSHSGESVLAVCPSPSIVAFGRSRKHRARLSGSIRRRLEIRSTTTSRPSPSSAPPAPAAVLVVRLARRLNAGGTLALAG
jgi:hypothetical protein